MHWGMVGDGKCFRDIFYFQFLYACFFPMYDSPPFCNKAYMRSRSDEKVIIPCCNVENMLIQLNMF